MSLNTNTIVLFVFVLVVALVLSWTYFTLARAFTKQFIWITGILNILFGIGTAIYYFVRHYYSAAIVFAVFGIFSIVRTLPNLFYLFRYSICKICAGIRRLLTPLRFVLLTGLLPRKSNADFETSIGLLRNLDSQDPFQCGHASADNGCCQVLRACLPRQCHWWYSLGCFWCLVLPHFGLW